MSNPARPLLRITFLLPLPGTHPIGGFKVVYEYANFLAAGGHHVTIVHPAIFRVDQPLHSRLPRDAANTIWLYLRNRITGEFRPQSWFKVSPAVRMLWVPSLAERYVPDADVLIATAWETAEWAVNYLPRKGRKFYLIQHFETWAADPERVLKTWRMPFEKIVIARWLQEIAEELGESAHLIHNGLDFNRFSLDTPIEARDPNSLLLIQHSLEWKGTAEGRAAFELAQRQHPALKLTLFGLTPPAEPARGVEFHLNPSQELLRKLYNATAIFLSPSWSEGFGLPAAEALQCGAALVATDIPGSASFAIHEQTALLSPPKSPEAMAENILRLIREPELRVRLAKQGNEFIQQFTWRRAGNALEEVLGA
jgi:glycosyltransferase involved in cell wall biosynthesis